MAIERIEYKLPQGYDPARHNRALPGLIAKVYGEGFEIEFIDPEKGVAVASRQGAINEVRGADKANTREVAIRAGTKPSDGDKVAIRLADAHPGFQMTRFEPFLGKAVLTRLSDDVARCRGAVAVALSVKPWEVQVTARKDGGFDLELPHSYVGSRHDAKLDEVATSVVGRDGWYVQVNAQKLTASIIPSDPPTFPEVFDFPLNRLGKGDLDSVSFGRVLPDPGEEIGPEISLDWTASAFVLVAGTPGSGKSVLLNAIVSDALSNGSELVIVDDQAKAVDFMWCKDFVRDGGWGCDSLAGAVGALGLVYAEGQRRAKVLAQGGYVNWLDMGKDRFTPILVIVDEVSALLVTDPPMKGIPKDHPLAIEITERNLARAMLQSFITKILAELRFVGIRMVLSTQATNANTGVGPSMRTKIGHSVLQGNNPSKAARSQIFSDETAVPTVPEHVKASGKRSRGVGVTTLEGQAPLIYKTYFAPTTAYGEALRKLKVRTTSRPAPTSAEIDEYLPTLDDESGKVNYQDDYKGERAPSGKPAAQLRREMGDEATHLLDEDGKRLTGFAAANANRAAVVAGSKPPVAPRTPDQNNPFNQDDA